MEDRNNFRKEEFMLTQEVSSPSQWESLVAGDSIASEAGKQRETNAGAQVTSPSHSVQDPSSWKGANHT